MTRPALYQSVLFDLDGTLVDTAPDFIRVLNRLRQTYGREPLPHDTIRAVVSAGARAMVQTGFPEYPLDSPEFSRIRQEFLDLYAEGLAEESRLFEGMDTILLALESRNIPWGVVTNKPRIYSEPLLAGLELDRRCRVLVCPDDVTRSKPDPEPMYLACRQLDVDPAQSAYVGDHIRDIEAGRNAGMPTIAAAWGYVVAGEDPRDWCADHLALEVKDLAALLNLN
ncbi:MAG: HAD-IA family hydrolase [Fluviicoccus sp.]|uniref:HAD family hydrolase n=1 Tax=Fluviicoccus sp. TaxID=2003552 RepID=UPI00271A6188|nr:HAD-IA family hydrolase [Fluviicoccus sp.]MDO8331829.1 HAD-IA family hydrolase [Fluviicoccus sp.]